MSTAGPSFKPPAALVKATAPVAKALAGKRFFPLWAVVTHRGRKSGTDYSVPVAVIPTQDTFVIGLPWGERTNWAQNVLAAGGAAIRWKGVDYRVTEPRIVGKDVALAASKGLERMVLSRGSFPAFIEVQRRPAA
jgi:deazaflavin-dependent oxidoreductase (nitroreductase family)